MNEINMTERYHTSEIPVDKELRKEIREDYEKDTPLVGYRHNPEKNTVTVIVDLQEVLKNNPSSLRYIR